VVQIRHTIEVHIVAYTYRDISDSDLRRGATFASLTAVFYATGVLFVRYAYKAGISPGTAIFLRFAIASMALALFLTLTRRWVRLAGQRVAALFLLGFLAYTILGTTWFVALSTTPAWLVSLFSALYPLVVSLGSWLFLGEVFDRRLVLALALVLTGSFALFWRPFEGAALTGVWLMVVNIFVVSLYLLVGQHWVHGIPPVVSATWMALGAMVGTLLYALLANQLSFDFAPMGWVWAALFAVVSTALAIVFLWQGIGLLGPSRATIIGSLEPFFSILLSVVVLGEAMSALQVVGGAAVLAGALLARLGTQKNG
jgi:drug/metabolite transporter (DMT)-like permease